MFGVCTQAAIRPFASLPRRASVIVFRDKRRQEHDKTKVKAVVHPAFPISLPPLCASVQSTRRTQPRRRVVPRVAQPTNTASTAR